MIPTKPFFLFTLLTLLLAVSAHSPYRHIKIRQDDGTQSATDGTDGTGDTESATPAASAEASAAPTDDTTDTAISASATPTETAAQSTATGDLGGAGGGGAYPVACASCANTYTLVALCESEGSSESCSPICTNWSPSVNCLSCLVSNGQANYDQTAAQQTVWNLEASCSSLGFNVASLTITATPTTTGAMTTPSGTITSAAGSKTSKSNQTGLTLYNDTTRSALVASLSQAVNPSATGAASRRMTKNEKGVVLAGMGVVGAMLL